MRTCGSPRSACATRLLRRHWVEAGDVYVGKRHEDAEVDITEPRADVHRVEDFKADLVTLNGLADEDAVVPEAAVAVRVNAPHASMCTLHVDH